MTAEVVTGYCEVCHRRLRDPLSIARRKGLTCWKKTARTKKQIEMNFEGKELTGSESPSILV